MAWYVRRRRAPTGVRKVKADEPDASDWKAIHALADRLEAGLRSSFLQAVQRLADSAGLANLQAAIGTGDPDRVSKILDLARFRREVADALETTLGKMAAETAGVEAEAVESRLGITVSLDLVNPDALAWAKDYSAKLVKDIDAETRAGIRTAVSKSIASGVPVDRLARHVRAIVGLTTRQATAVSNYLDGLIAAGVAPGAADLKAAAYAARLRTSRARTIARTELIASSGAGQKTLWDRLKADGIVDAKARKRWRVTPDDRLDEEVCEPMDGQTVDLDELFTTGTGERVAMQPAHPNCRCVVVLVP